MKYVLAAVLLLIACEPMQARAPHKAPAHHVGAFVTPRPGVGRGQRIFPAYSTATRVRAINQGLVPEIITALTSTSSEQVYRGELCKVLTTHAEQRACLRHQP